MEAVNRSMEFGSLTGEARRYEGLGGATSMGRRKCQIGLECQPLNMKPLVVLEGSIYSNELAKGDSLMLLSLSAQAALGLIKDVQAGTCYVKGEESYIQLYSVVGSGLRAVVVYDPSWKERLGIVDDTNATSRINSSC